MSNQYRFSQFKTYAQCPRKHHYNYVEGIEQPENKNLLAGTLFHEAIELYYNGQPVEPVFKKYRDAVMRNVIDESPDLLEEVFSLYTNYYAKAEAEEVLIANEMKVILPLEGEDTISATIDRVVSLLSDETNILRDTKTTFKALKYTADDVRYNQQLHWYRTVVETELGIDIDAVEIDEVRLAQLKRPPLNQNGKPSADKKRLDLVTYDEYYNTLAGMGLQDAPEYKQILLWLEQRGHPLFRRTRVQLLDHTTTDSILEDMNELYHACKAGAKFRIRGPLCNYCGYKDLCNLDHHQPDSDGRQFAIEKIAGRREE